MTQFLFNLHHYLHRIGKTTILKLISGESINNLTPTAGFNVKNLAIEGINLNVIDVGGKLKPILSTQDP